MLNIQTLSIGHYLLYKGEIVQVTGLSLELVTFTRVGFNCPEVDGIEAFEGVPLTGELLRKCGFLFNPTRAIGNPFNFSLPNRKEISISNVGTPNEMVFLNEYDGIKITDCIVIRNWDYVKRTYLHQLQSFVLSLTVKPLEVNL